MLYRDRCAAGVWCQQVKLPDSSRRWRPRSARRPLPQDPRDSSHAAESLTDLLTRESPFQRRLVSSTGAQH